MHSPHSPSLRASTLPPTHAAASTVSTLRPRVTREEQRERERRSRRSRVEKSTKMRFQVTELEKMALALRVLPDADVVWDAFVDEDTKRLRGELRHLRSALGETRKLNLEKVQLQQILADHRTTGLLLQSLLKKQATADDWESKTLAWKAITRRHFRPWTKDRVMELTSQALLEIEQFTHGRHGATTGLSFMGWHDSVQFLPNSTVIRFILHKKMQGYYLDQHLGMAWRMYTDEATYRTVVLGGRGRVSLDIVQRVTPTAWVIRVAEKHDLVDTVVHKMVLLARVETDDGAMLCIKSFEDIEVQKEINSDTDWWMDSSTWSRYETLEPELGRASTLYRMYIGGLWDVADTAFLPKWYAEILGIAIRAEAAGKGHWQLTFE